MSKSIFSKGLASSYDDVNWIEDGVEEFSADDIYPSPLDDFSPETFGNHAIQHVETALDLVNNVTTSIRDYAMCVQRTKLEISKLDHDLDKFIAEKNVSLEKFKSAMPVLE